MTIVELPTPVFCGVDWAEDHVRHEALEVERG